MLQFTKDYFWGDLGLSRFRVSTLCGAETLMWKTQLREIVDLTCAASADVAKLGEKREEKTCLVGEAMSVPQRNLGINKLHSTAAVRRNRVLGLDHRSRSNIVLRGNLGINVLRTTSLWRYITERSSEK